MKRINRRKFIKKIIVFILVIFTIDIFWLEFFLFETKKYFMKSSSEGKYNFKVLQLSDLHLNNITYTLHRISAKINKENPDIILLTGDIIDKKDNIDLLEDFLKTLPKTKKIAILGNWEYWGHVDIQKLKAIYKRYNCELLINNTVQFSKKNKTLSISGVDDLLGGKPDIDKVMENYISSDYPIVLNNCPEYYDKIVKYKNQIDLVLSGHTHGGQINFFGYIPFIPEGSGKYVKGWYHKNNLPLYVSKGVGSSILPIRFGARSEISVFYI